MAASVMTEAPSGPNTHTTSPMITGATVLACKFNGGVMIMADTLGSYGTLARFTNLQRIQSVNDTTLVAASGEYSDFQYTMKLLTELGVMDFEHSDGRQLTGREIYSYLSRVMYNRRSKVDPLYNYTLVASVEARLPPVPSPTATVSITIPKLEKAPSTVEGKASSGKKDLADKQIEGVPGTPNAPAPNAPAPNAPAPGGPSLDVGKDVDMGIAGKDAASSKDPKSLPKAEVEYVPFLGQVDLYGSCFEDDFMATGFGTYLAMPLLRREWRSTMTRSEAKQLLERCMNVCFYRDCRALNKYLLATITKDGAQYEGPYSLDTYWEYRLFVSTTM